MTTPNPTPARDAAEIARNDLALRIAMDVLGDMGRANGLAEWFGNENTDLGQAVARLITVARADERAQLAARATEQERGMVDEMDLASEVYWTSCDGAEKHRAAERCRSAEATLLAALTAARERALEEAVAIERERRIVTGGTMAEHIADVRAAFSEGAQCAGLSEDGALEMWQHSAALGKLRDTGAFEQALAGRKEPA